ncbi:hypothetical protein ROZALSC1DRAFT_30331 [Rozella allomycis CSF55]|uniref:C3H1-type domain-containing protein n=1 Tax=Rozella allomycis (strain CSF55) TaxID=988480 RepID=A0A4P9YFA6_ROZAC|nr:hypothetical protein ROZALSC1DRAFT_30331 [Rozella allomycis CSF55]
MQNEDCYYFITSTCARGASCLYRHSEKAKGTIEICKDWQLKQSCQNADCELRHSVYGPPVNRSETQCYWEMNGGCLKPNCPFKHQIKKPLFPVETNGKTEETNTAAANKTKDDINLPKQVLKKAELKMNTEQLKKVEEAKKIQDNKETKGKNTLDFHVKSFEEIIKEKRLRQATKNKEEEKKVEGKENGLIKEPRNVEKVESAKVATENTKLEQSPKKKQHIDHPILEPHEDEILMQDLADIGEIDVNELDEDLRDLLD